MVEIVSYLAHMDKLKERYIETKSVQDTATYAHAHFHFYQEIKYITTEGISFRQFLCAVKLVNTAIVFTDQHKSQRVYFTDGDIRAIVKQISDRNLKEHIIAYLKKAITDKELSILTFMLGSKTFNIKGIPFKAEFNDVLCKNPADIDINGNDIIGLINLILEKERFDKMPNKLADTARFYMS